MVLTWRLPGLFVVPPSGGNALPNIPKAPESRLKPVQRTTSAETGTVTIEGLVESMETSKETWDTFREAMPVTAQWAYFDHAAVAPISAPARNAIVSWSDQSATEGDTIWSEWARRIEEVRRTAARLMNARSEEVSLVPNTTTGISLVAEGLAWESGDNVVTVAGEFPSNLYPWIHLGDRGVQERRVTLDGFAVDPNRIAEACDERTRVVAISWVGYAGGWRIDPGELARVAHDHGALLFLDAIQGFGVFPIDVRAAGVDFLAADGHKWMLGPEGAGLLYVRGEHLHGLRPHTVGWNSVVGGHDFHRIELRLRPEAARFEGGSQNMVGFHALGASLDLLEQCGLSSQQSAVADRVLAIVDHACERLVRVGARIASDRSAPGRHGSGILSFEFPHRDAQAVVRAVSAAGVVLSCRAGRLRISPHGYNNEEDVERLVAALQAV
jgi:selenocysteine lyase/cysteine desulfurase